MGEAKGEQKVLGNKLHKFTLCKKQCQSFQVDIQSLVVFYLQGNGVQSEIPNISDWVIQSILDTPQLGGVVLQKLGVVLQLNLCVYFCRVEDLVKDTSAGLMLQFKNDSHVNIDANSQVAVPKSLFLLKWWKLRVVLFN